MIEIIYACSSNIRIAKQEKLQGLDCYEMARYSEYTKVSHETCKLCFSPVSSGGRCSIPDADHDSVRAIRHRDSPKRLASALTNSCYPLVHVLNKVLAVARLSCNCRVGSESGRNVPD